MVTYKPFYSKITLTCIMRGVIMGLFSKKENQKLKPIDLIYIDGVKGYNKGTSISLSLEEELNCVVVQTVKNNLPKVNLDLEKIVAVDIIHERDVIEANKSTVGRAMVGGIVLGPLGAIIGGISGVGTKKNTKLRDFLVINYKSQNEIKALSFEMVKITLNVPKFINTLRDKIKNNESAEIYL